MPRPVNRISLNSLLPVFLLLVSSVSAPALRADELLLRDGSRLVGEIVSRDDGILGFKTAFAGLIRVKWQQIATINAEKPMEFLLADDRTLMVTRVINEEDSMRVETENGAPPRTLSQEEVALINPEPWRKGQGVKFSGHANASVQRQTGNTDKDEIDLDGDMTLRRRYDRFKVFAELEKDRAENKKIKDAWRLENDYNYFVSKQWYMGGFARFAHDQFADLDLRTTVGPLVGYQWFESEDLNLSTSTGLSYVREDFSTEPDNDYFAIPWNIDFDKYLFGHFAQFYHKQTGFWSLEDTQDVVVDTWTGLRFPLVLGLVASTELKVRYDGSAAATASKTDTTYSVKLGYQW